MGPIPHYIQTGRAPAIAGAGFGMFGCPCGQSLLISGYEPRHFLGVAIQCAACGQIAETPGLPPGAIPPAGVTPIQRGAADLPTAVTNSMYLIGQEEANRLAALYQPRETGADLHRISDALLDDVAFEYRRLTERPLDPLRTGYKAQPLDWSAAHFRKRLRDPDWTTFASDTDRVAMTVIAAFRDMFGAWSHHPFFTAMMRAAATQGFSLHAMAAFGASKALMLSGNRVGFVATEGPQPRIVEQRVMLGDREEMPVAVNRFDRFEWPDDTDVPARSVNTAVIEAMDQVRGHINRLHPGFLVLSPGASRPEFDRLLLEAVTAAIASHGKRHRGLAALAVIFPKTVLTGQPGEVRFGWSFHPVPNRNHAIGRSVLIGSRADHAGLR
jgi:hypothetical protein